MVKKETTKKNGTKIETLSEDMASLERYAYELFSFIPLPTVFTGTNGVILEANPAFVAITGKNLYEIIGDSVESFLNEKDAKKILRETLSGGSIMNKETTISGQGGRIIPVSTFSRARISDKKQIIGIFLSVFDLSEVKKSKEELEEAKEVLEIKVAARTRELEDLTRDLEEKVKERTKELEERLEELKMINKLMVGRELKMVELKEQLGEAEEKINKFKSHKNE